jgi:chromosome segregation ATPase
MEWITKLIEASPVALLLIVAIVALWRWPEILKAQKELHEAQSKPAADHSQQMLEGSKAMTASMGLLRELYSEIVEDKNALELKSTEITARLASSENEIEKLQKKVGELENKLAERERELDATKKRVGELERDLEQERADRKALESERNDAKSKVTELTAEVEQLRHQIDDLTKRINGDGKSPSKETADASTLPPAA